jgi:hypothetical protein
MNTVDKAIATQLANIEARSGRTLDQLREFITASGLVKHGQIRDLLKSELGMGHGDANTVAHFVLGSPSVAAAQGQAVDADAALNTIYTGPKAALRPLHDLLMTHITALGQVEVAPKKTYVSLRRKKQFAMLGPATAAQVELGLNCRELVENTRLKALPAGGMCSHKVRLSSAADVDAELLGWLRQAFDTAG